MKRRGGGSTCGGLPAGDAVLIVNYHAIGPERSPISCTLEELRSDICGLRDAGFEFVTLDQCADWLEGRAASARAAAITFDDGYASVATRAVPFLAGERVPCAVFVIAGRLGGDNRWPGQWKSVPTLPLVDRAMIAEMEVVGKGGRTRRLPPGPWRRAPTRPGPGATRQVEDPLDEEGHRAGRPRRRRGVVVAVSNRTGDAAEQRPGGTCRLSCGD